MALDESIVGELKGLVPLIVRLSDLRPSTRRVLAGVQSTGRGIPPVIIAFGKGALSMVEGALEVLDGNVEGGVVVVPRGTGRRIPGLEVLESTHPLPSDASLRAGEAVLEWARSAGRTGRLVALISGGGSALVEVPQPGLELEDIVEVNRVMLNGGLSILEINIVRKHLSMVKGGRLAETAQPAETTGIYASDVPGDRLDLIASGPTVPDPSTYNDAIRTLKIRGLWDSIPERARKVLVEGANGLRPETPKPGSRVFERVHNILSASNLDVLRGLQAHLAGKGYNTLILTSRIGGESREVAKALAGIALEGFERGIPVARPGAVLVGGETSVTVKGRGRGGRNMELALAWVVEADYWTLGSIEKGRIGILSMDTDGIDGVTDAAGAIAYNGLTADARSRGLDPDIFLSNNDSYTFFDRLGLLVRTGPTGSNLNSLTVILYK